MTISYREFKPLCSDCKRAIEKPGRCPICETNASPLPSLHSPAEKAALKQKQNESKTEKKEEKDGSKTSASAADDGRNQQTSAAAD